MSHLKEDDGVFLPFLRSYGWIKKCNCSVMLLACAALLTCAFLLACAALAPFPIQYPIIGRTVIVIPFPNIKKYCF